MTTINGTDGNDTLAGTDGDDELLGGDGDDFLSDPRGNDVVNAGAGDDTISMVRDNGDSEPRHEHVSILAGDGNDQVSVDVPRVWPWYPRSPEFTIDLGSGNDRVFLDDSFSFETLTTGTGSDEIELGRFYLSNARDDQGVGISVTDFSAGVDGDVIDLGAMLISSGWNGRDNPFATGLLMLQQVGADTVVAYAGFDQPLSLIRLANVQADDLDAFNFMGFDPGKAVPVNQSLSGTDASDSLQGGLGRDTLRGFGGDDVLLGSFGDDRLQGDEGNDTLEGGYGTDVLDGGAGNDVIRDIHTSFSSLQRRSDTLIGGRGDDLIIVQHGYSYTGLGEITIDAGSGADDVTFSIASPGSLDAVLGDGDDRITMKSFASEGAKLALGAGSDVVVLDAGLAAQSERSIVITDFEAGDGGDRLDLAIWYMQDFRPGPNPFASGAAQLQQSGADTLFILQGALTVVFKNTDVSSFTDQNFGLDISARPPVPDPETHVGTNRADTIRGTDGGDVISGLGGGDVLTGGAGDDWLRGGKGADRVDGGDGNDTIGDPYGTDSIVGGAGSDKITVYVDLPTGAPIGGLRAGAGNDSLFFTSDVSSVTYRIAMGAGDDHVRIRAIASTTELSLGDGRDTVELPKYFSNENASFLHFTDFEAGDDGDVLDLSGFLSTAFHVLWSPGNNPFEDGYLELRQVGSDVELWRYWSGRGSEGSRVARFDGTTVAEFTAANFGGHDPQVPVNAGTIVGTSPFVIGPREHREAIDAAPFSWWQPHFIYQGYTGKFVNHGTVLTEATRGRNFDGLVGFFFQDQGTRALFLNASDGEFIVHKYGEPSTDFGWYRPTAIGVTGLNGAAGLIRNDGYFEVTATSGGAIGAVTYHDRMDARSVVNNGTWIVDGDYATGVQMGYAAGFENNGVMTVSGSLGARGVYTGQYHGQSVVNNGTITVTTPDNSPRASIAVDLPEIEEPSSGVYRHINHGTITADYAYYIWEVNDWDGGFTDVLENTGFIDGAVVLGRGDDVVLNSGLISSRTFLQDGNDVYDGRAGFHRGSVEGGAGSDTLRGGTGGESLFGDGGSDLLDGGVGDDFLDGGSGSDRLNGGLGFDTLSFLDALAPVHVDLAAGTASVAQDRDTLTSFEQVIGSRAGDTLLGSNGEDVLLGFVGDDVVKGRGGADVLQGGRGNDTLTGGAGNDVFVFDNGDGEEVITDFSAGDHIEVHGYEDSQSVEQAGDDVLVTLGTGDSIIVRNSMVDLVTESLSFDGTPIDQGGSVLGHDSLHADGTVLIGPGIELLLGNPVSLAEADSNAMLLSDGARVWNAGTLSIVSTGAGVTARGMAPLDRFAKDHGQVVIETTGALEVSATAGDAVGVDWISRVWNSGTISVGSASGDAWGIGNVNPDGMQVVNSGQIVVSAAGSAHGVAPDPVTSLGVSHCANTGVVDVHGGEQSFGFKLRFSDDSWNPQPPSTFVNSGRIEVTDETDIADSVGLSINLAGQASVWNTGTISADFALRVVTALSGDNDYPFGIKVYNTGVLDGLVLTSGWDDTLVNNGSITGLVSLGRGDDLYDGRGGRVGALVQGYSGADTLLGGSGADTLAGGSSGDTIVGGQGDDLLAGDQGRDTFYAGARSGSDEIVDFAVGADHDYIALSGTATYTLAQDGSNLVLTLSGGSSLRLRNVSLGDFSADMVLTNVAVVGATPVPKKPVPDAPGQLIDGLDADDTLIGGDGYDSLHGQAGNDSVRGGAGGDALFGGLDADVLIAGGGADTLAGELGNDLLNGEAGNDLLFGNEGRDTLSGGGGNDTLEGGLGKDLLAGGSGADWFIFHTVAETLPGARDVIQDFQRGLDRIDLSDIDADALLPGVQRLTYIGGWQNRNSDATGQLGYVVESGKVIVYGSTDADPEAEFAIEVHGVGYLGADAFQLW